MLAEIERFVNLSAHQDEGYALASHDIAFHDMIFHAVGNTFIHAAYRQLHAHLHLFRLYPADLHGTQTIAEHRAIAEAINRVEPEAAEEAMRNHLFAAMDRFSAGLVGRTADRTLTSVRSHVLPHPDANP